MVQTPGEILKVLGPRGALEGELPELEDSRLRELFCHMLRVRCVDDRMLKLQRAGRVGFVGPARGLEGAMIGSAAVLRPTDWLWSGLREGGAAVMRGLPLAEYIAQMYCNSNDTAKGRQMCNHFQHQPTNYPSWSSVIGTQIAHGVGAAFASKQRGEDTVHAIYFGDGATSANSFHSGLNFAAVWEAPVVFICVDNGWAISVPSSQQTAASSYAAKARAYGMPGVAVDGNDVLACYQAANDAVEAIRGGGGPRLIVLHTYRMLGHSSSDDPSTYRDEDEVAAWKKLDPIDRYAAFLVKRGVLGEDEREAIEAEFMAEIDAVIHEQEAAEAMSLATLIEDVYEDVPRHLKEQYNAFIQVAKRHGEAERGEGEFPL